MESPLVVGVVGVDGSDASLTAVDWAVDEAVRHAVPLRIVHASMWERYEGVVPAWSTDRPSGQVLAENIAAIAAERARRRAPDLSLTTDVLPEDASSALLREGREGTILVVGSRGRSEFTDLLLGSVSLIVAARAQCPVVVVRGDRQALEARHGRVLLGVGEHDLDSPAVRFAFREAAVRDAQLDVVRTWRRQAHEPADHLLMRRAGAAYFTEGASELLDKAIDAAASEQPQVRLRRSTVEGPAHRVLTERSAAADLLVLGARRRDGLVGLELGRVVHRALHHASCPVVVVPQRAPETMEGDQ
ncbi:universal stress protein [Streptomyces sp. NPDC056549]|uniref:universal stress protein n=1 Tax=Streptomyces sp. NPDC056549 TaxID=3345864 RepID=UPI0036CD0773